MQPDRMLSDVDPRDDPRTAIVYFVQAMEGGPIKIGHSTLGAWPKRFDQLQTSNWQEMALRRAVVGDKRLEKALHAQFAEARVRGEWFRPVSELAVLCGGLTEAEKGARTPFRNQDG